MEGIFAISKPSGPSSAQAVSALKSALNASPYVENSSAWAKANGVKIKLTTDKRKKQWWYKKHDKNAAAIGGIKVGHGGTLDPLASGVIVIGVGEGTKTLTKFLTDCTKVYEATAIFGAATTTYDSTGSTIQYSQDLASKLSPEALQQTIAAHFKGPISQYPPVYSALKMDGKPLYEYARQAIPLPRKIEPRDSTVQFFDIVPGSFAFVAPDQIADLLPTKMATEDELAFYLRETMPPPTASLSDLAAAATPPPQFARVKFRFSVSSGTYIRSLIHDVATQMGLTAYMATLVRVQQGPFELGKNVFDLDDITKNLKDEEWVPMVKLMLERGPDITIDHIKQLAQEDKEKKARDEVQDKEVQDKEVQDKEVQNKEVQDKEVQDKEVQDKEVQDKEVQNKETKLDQKTTDLQTPTEPPSDTQKTPAQEPTNTAQLGFQETQNQEPDKHPRDSLDNQEPAPKKQKQE